MEGFPALAPCYEVVEISGLTRWRARSTKGLSSFVGRDEQIAQLQRAAQEVGPSGKIAVVVMSLATTRPLLVLLTWRTEYAPDWLAGFDVLRIWLRSLNAASANTLLDNLLGTAADLDALKTRILRHTGQNPLFIEEVARQLTGRSVTADGVAAETRWDTLEIPPTVQGVIASRIDRLQKEDKALLQLAAGPDRAYRSICSPP
jgi:predicted ATPase